jgi:hypothetical protein
MRANYYFLQISRIFYFISMYVCVAKSQIQIHTHRYIYNVPSYHKYIIEMQNSTNFLILFSFFRIKNSN